MIAAALLFANVASGFFADISDKPVIFLLAKSEQDTDLALIKRDNIATDKILEQTGLVVHKYETLSRIIFVSEKVAPLNAYKNSAKLLTDIAKENSDKFTHGSEIGQTIGSFYSQMALRKKSSAKPSDESFAIVLIARVNDAEGSLKMPINDYRGTDVRKLDHPEIEQYSAKEAHEVRKKEPSAKLLGPALFLESAYAIRPLDQGRLPEEEIITNFAEISECTQQVSKELSLLFKQYQRQYDYLVDWLKNKYGVDLAQDSIEGTDLDDLSPQMQKSIRNNLTMSPQSYGFASVAEAEAYLETNPKMRIAFNLALFEGTSTRDPNTGELNRGGGFITLYNPKEKPRQSPPP